MRQKHRKHYNKGANYERALKKQLEMAGYYVMRSAGSKGPADLIAINNQTKKIKVIQAKTYKGELTDNQKEKLKQKIPLDEDYYFLENEVL